jgi:uncharacterized protein YcaQ
VTPSRKVSALAVRQFLRRAHLLDAPAAGVGAVLDHHGYVQIDPINICGRMHDHILRNRVKDYREGGLMRHLHEGENGSPLAAEQRTAFEHHLPSADILVAFPLSAWPHLRAAMRARTKRTSAWSGRLTAREREFAKTIMEVFAGGGGVGPEAFADHRRGRSVWGSATLAKSTLQKLFFHGELLISGRQSNRRLYDLPERVLPSRVLALSEPTAEETARWLALTRLRQHRLVALRRAEVPLVEDRVQPIAVDGCPSLYCLNEDLHWFEPTAPAGVASAAAEALLLAPLDPLIYDRRLTRHLWDFDYTWEAYVPAPKRKRGYYALPVLSGHELVGYVDVRADHSKGRLGVVSRSVRRGHRTASAIGSLSRFLSLA